MEESHFNDHTGIIILAAGASTRMGQSKQLLTIEGKSLLLRSVETALACKDSNTIVVLGANAAACIEELKNHPVTVVVNHNWESGMGSSIKAGLLSYLEKKPNGKSILIMVIDQPKVSTSHLNTIIECIQTFTKSIVASFYGNTPAVPAIFSQVHFNEILSMDDGAGAKKIILAHPDKLLTIGFPEGDIDLDTPEEYERYKRTK